MTTTDNDQPYVADMTPGQIFRLSLTNSASHLSDAQETFKVLEDTLADGAGFGQLVKIHGKNTAEYVQHTLSLINMRRSIGLAWSQLAQACAQGMAAEVQHEGLVFSKTMNTQSLVLRRDELEVQRTLVATQEEVGVHIARSAEAQAVNAQANLRLAEREEADRLEDQNFRVLRSKMQRENAAPTPPSQETEA